MSTFARPLKLNMLRACKLINHTSFILSALKTSKDKIMPTNLGAIANVVDQAFSVPKKAKADGAVSVQVYISAPDVTKAIFLKHMEAETLKGIKAHITLTACKRNTGSANQRFASAIYISATVP